MLGPWSLRPAAGDPRPGLDKGTLQLPWQPDVCSHLFSPSRLLKVLPASDLRTSWRRQSHTLAASAVFVTEPTVQVGPAPQGAGLLVTRLCVHVCVSPFPAPRGCFCQSPGRGIQNTLHLCMTKCFIKVRHTNAPQLANYFF